jgi:hypothetical protein
MRPAAPIIPMFIMAPLFYTVTYGDLRSSVTQAYAG